MSLVERQYVMSLISRVITLTVSLMGQHLSRWQDGVCPIQYFVIYKTPNWMVPPGLGCVKRNPGRSFIVESHRTTDIIPELSGIYTVLAGRSRGLHNIPLLRDRKSSIQYFLQ